MWNWYSGDGAPPSAVAPDNPGSVSVADLTEQLAQTQQLVVQLKDLIREKDNDLRKKDQQLKEEKDSSESKISKAKLQSKAKIASLTSQLEELKKQLASPQANVKKPESKKGSGDGDQENASANRGKILVLRKRVEDLESQLSSKNEALQKKESELEAQRLRGSEMDAMLATKEKKLAEKEAYIIDLQMSAASNLSQEVAIPESPLTLQDSSQDLQILIQNLNRKVGESEEKYSLLREQTESLKALLNKEKREFQEKEAMYAENIRVYQNIILEKEKEMKELSQKHEQEIFKLAAKSDATADLHQLLKALKQKLHEEEEVLSGKNQVIDVLQKELDSKDQQFTEMNEKCKRLLSEKENLQSKLEAEKHVMRAQLRDMMEKHETEMRTLNDRHTKTLQDIQETHKTEVQEKFQTIQQLQKQLQGLASAGDVSSGSAVTTDPEIVKLQGEVKLKKEEASKSEAKFLIMKAWSKSRIRQLEEELKIAEGKNHELSQLNVRIAELEEDKRALEMKLESAADLQALNEQLLAKLVAYEEQQRKLQADLEQVTKRADSQTSESGSTDEMQNQLLEWHEMSTESDITPEQEREETCVMALRMAQIEEEREGLIEDDWFFPGCSDPAMDSGQVELEEELSTARGLGKLRPPQRKGSRGASKLQGEFDYSNKSFEEQNLTMESGDSIEGENMGGLRVVVEELELERNQLQEQIMTLEERCQELGDRLQLQLRIESLQSENERLQTQVLQLRQQQSQDSEKHHDLVSTLNDQLKSLTNRNAFLENAVVEKDLSIVEVSSKLDQLGVLRKSLQEKETQNKELWEKLDQCENELEEVTKKLRMLESENSVLILSNHDLTEKVSAFKERVFVQDSSLEKLQVDLDQTNDDLDRLNASHLEERSLLIYDLQRCEREVDVLKEVLQEKDKEMSSLSTTLTEYSEQISILKETIDFKDEQMREMSDALFRIDREHHLLKEAQTMDVHETSSKISSLTEQLSEMEIELINAKSLYESKSKELEELIRQINENGITIRNLRQEIQTQSVTHNNHVTECSMLITSLKEQMKASVVKFDEMELKYKKEIENLRIQLEMDDSEKARFAVLLQEQGNKEQSFVNDLKAAKEQHDRLVSDLLKKDKEIEQLSKDLTEKNDICNKLNKELSVGQEELSSLKKAHETLAVERDGLVKALQENAEEFKRQIVEKSEFIKILDLEKKDLLAQYKVLETSLSDKESTLQLQTSSCEQLVKKVQGLEERNQHLYNEKENLLTQANHKDSEISNLNESLKDVQIKLVETEQQLSEEQKHSSGLLQDKEELLSKTELISSLSSQNNSTFAAQLEEQAKECLRFKDQLHQEQKSSQKLHIQIQALESDLTETQKHIQEKDDVLRATTFDYKATCENLKQNLEQNTLLEKQVEELNKVVENERRSLQEKDLLLTTLDTQLKQMTSNVEKLQNKEKNLNETNVKLTEIIEGSNAANAKLQEELSYKGIENTSLTERLEVRNKEIEKLTQEKDSTFLSISNLENQCFTLQSQVSESKLLADSLTQQVTTLNSESEKMKSDIQLLNTNLSDKSAEINVLSSHLSQQGHTILSLKDQIDTVQLEKQSLVRSLEEKDDLLLKKEELIQQVEKKLESEGYYLQTISALQNELQSSVSECDLQHQRVKNQELEIQKLMQQMQLLKDKSEEAGLLKTQLSEYMETISDLHCQIKNLSDKVDELNGDLTKKDQCLKEKVDSYLNLKAHFSELQDSLEEQRGQIETLTVENTQYKNYMSQKELEIANSTAECDKLKQTLADKDGKWDALVQQIKDLEENNRNQNNELNDLKVCIKEQETSFLGKHDFLNTQLEEKTKLVSQLQNTVLELNNTISGLRQSINDTENTMQNLQEKYTSLHDHKQELAQILLKKEEENSNHLRVVNEKNARLQILESNIQAFTSEVNLLKVELEKSKLDVISMSDNLKMKDEVIFRHQRAAEVAKVELEKLNIEYQENKTQLLALAQEKGENISLTQSLQEKCCAQNQLIENLKHDLDSLDSNLLQVKSLTASEKEQFLHQLATTTQEKLDLENRLRSLQAEQDSSLTMLERQLIDRTQTIKELEEKLERQVKDSEARFCSHTEALNQLKGENADLQNQVSGKTEEISSLKFYLATVERHLSEQKQQSEKEFERMNKENSISREQNYSLESRLQVKEIEVQGLLKDLYFVEEQLCMICDEKISEIDSCNPQYSGRIEKLSLMFSGALNYKTKVSELIKTLESKDHELDNKSQAIITFEKESEMLQTELQKVKEEKFGSDYAISELAAAKEALVELQSLCKIKEEGLEQLNTHVATLQEEIKLNKEDLQKSQLIISEEKAKVRELLEEVKEKSSFILNMNIQLNQQRELISTLSEQIKEKDSSLMQIMESMSNEMVKYSEEKKILKLELQNLQSERSSCLSQISELSEKFKDCEIQLQQSEKMLADKETFLSNLSNEKDLQGEKFNKERENLKRKLQAALVIRKDLMQKIEKLEQSKQDDVNAEQVKISELEGKLDELSRGLEMVMSENRDLQSRIELGKQEILKREAETCELNKALSEKEILLVELQNKVTELQNNFSEKESMCQEFIKSIEEKEHIFAQVKSTMKEKLKTLEEENMHLVENLEVIKSYLEKAQGRIEPSVANQEISSNSSASVPVTPESGSAEVSFSHSENSIVHNNVHASLLCSQGNVESKGKHSNLIESFSKSIKQFELLQKAHAELQFVFDSKCTEYSQQREQILTLGNQIHSQQELLFSKELELANKDKDLDQLRLKTDETSHKMKEYEDLISVLKASIQEKDEQVLSINSEHLQLMSESQSLKSEIQKLSHDVEQKQEEVSMLKNAVDSQSVDGEKYEVLIENMKTELGLLQKEIKKSRKIKERNKLSIEEITNEKNIYSENCQANQVEIAKLKNDLEFKAVELFQKEKDISVLKDSLHANLQTSEDEIEKLRYKLDERQEEVDKLRTDYAQMKEEQKECLSRLEKAHVEISSFRTKVNDFRKEEERSIQSGSIQLINTTGLNQIVLEAKPTSDNLQEVKDYVQPMCEDCIIKQKMIGVLEEKAITVNSAMEDLKNHERRLSEEKGAKEQIQRKLQAALVSRKDLMKENKALKQSIESLNLETDGLKLSLEEIQEKDYSEIALLTNRNKTLLSDNEHLSLDNENLSAACESLKSTMETIVQEKEAFSFQLNSLKDSQRVELTEWKAKHGELNKEYESLLQAYENISDEIDKMKQVIDLTKKEKLEIVIKMQSVQNENLNMSKQIEENSKEFIKHRTTLESKEEELREIKLQVDGLDVMAKKSSQITEITENNQQLLEDNRNLQETCENLKLCLENKEKENNSLFVIKTALDKLQADMNMYKSDMEIKISEMSSENEVLLKKLTEVSIKLEQAEQNLVEVEAERDSKLQTLKEEKDALLKLDSDIGNMRLENINLEEKVKILEDDKALLLDEIENIQEQFCAVKNERESMEMELLKAVKNNSLLSDKFKSLQAQTNILSQQVEYLRTEKNNIVREREQQQLQVLQDLEEKVKSAQNDNRGTKNKSKELQELLKEKQQEINQLQRDSIRFQELILNLEVTVKESNWQNETLKKELEFESSELTQVRKEFSFLKGKLVDKELLLDSTNTQMSNLTTEFREISDELSFDQQTHDIDKPLSPHPRSLGGMARHQRLVKECDSKGEEFGIILDINGVKSGLEEIESTPLANTFMLGLEVDHPAYQHEAERSRAQLNALQSMLSKREHECQQLTLEYQKMSADVQKQVTMSEHLKQIINNKDKEISLLISLKDGEVSSYLEHIQRQYRKEGEECETRLSAVQSEKEKSELECQKLEKELQNLRVTYEKAVSDNLLLSKDIEAFRKSMSSLQTNRDQLSSELQGIHQYNESILKQKDNIIISISAQNSALKAELRNVLNRIDDLNAENAMLGAQLIRYREDLNQVLSLKDHQLKELLRQKLEHIKNLEQEKCDLEKQNREMQHANAALQSSAGNLQLENQKLMSKVKDQEDLIATINKEKLIFGSRNTNDSIGSDDLQIKDERYNQNVVLNGESNKTTEKTVKTSTDVLLENEKLRSENESFGKAMAALQNNRDSLIDDFKELQWRYASELKTEKIRGDDLERELRDFKLRLYALLTKSSLIDKTVFASENQMTLDQLVAEMDSVFVLLANRGSEITRLSSESAAYAQQVDAFSKSMASLQRDRERLLQQLKDPTLVRESRQSTTGKPSPGVVESDYLSTNRLQSEPSQVTHQMNSSAEESFKQMTRVQELERLLQEAKSLQEKMERDVTGYQCELVELRFEKNVLVTEVQSLSLQFSAALGGKDRQIIESSKGQEAVKFGSMLFGEKGLEKMALVGNSAGTEKINPILENKEPAKHEVQRYIQEIQQRDVIIQQINAKAMESIQMNAVLSAQLKSVSQGLKDTQMKYTDLQSQYFKQQRDLQTSQVTNRNDILCEVPPGAPQERTNVIVEIDNVELADLRRRLAENEFSYDATQQEISQLLERLAEERARREAAEDALRLSEQQNQRLETKPTSRDYEFSLQMESDDEREALIIDPTQNVVVRKIKGGSLSLRRWLRGRSLYCSKLLTSRSKSRYLFLAYLLGLHILILMCLSGML